MARTIKTTDKADEKAVLTPRLAGLREELLGGGRVSRDDFLTALAEDTMSEWRKERAEIVRQQTAAERASWSDELARFIATTLAATDDNGFPSATVFTTDPTQIIAGNPAVLIQPASQVRHTGGGLAKGKVALTLHNVKCDGKKLVAVMAPHSTMKVNYGNWPTTTLSSDGWVFDLPFVANPSAAQFADIIKRDLENMNVNVTPDGGTAYTLGAYAKASIGVSEVVSKSEESVTLRGHLLAQGKSTNPSSDAPYTNSEMIAVAKRAVERIAATSGFVMGVGIVTDAQVTKTEAVKTDDGEAALGIQFEVEAKGRYIQ